MTIAHTTIACRLDFCKHEISVILIILNNLPFPNVNINNKQQY